MSTPRNYIENSCAEFDGAFIGVAFGNTVVYNVLEIEGDFSQAGLSIIEHLRRSPAKFCANLVESTIHGPIEGITDDRIIYGEENHVELTTCGYGDAIALMMENDVLDNYYVYDTTSDMLLVKTLTTLHPVVLDYAVEEDVVRYLNHVDKTQTDQI